MSSGNTSNSISSKLSAQLGIQLNKEQGEQGERGGGGNDGGESEEREENCVCGRPRHNIKCAQCLHSFVGRLRLTCPAHPGIFYLMDIANCSKCGAARQYLYVN